MNLLIGIGYNALLALFLNCVILFLIGYIIKLFQLRLSQSVTYILSVFVATSMCFLTIVIFFKEYCSLGSCSNSEFFFSLILISVAISLVGYSGYLSLKLGYGKPLGSKRN